MKISNKQWLKGLLFAGSCALSTQALASIPYVDHHLTVKQPDGTTLELVINGTTHYADQRTLDGYPVIYDAKLKGYTFARLSKDRQSFQSTGILANERNKRSIKGLSKDIDIPKRSKRAIGERNARTLKSHGVKMKNDKQVSSLTDSTNLVGDVKGLTILIQFPDQNGTISRSDVNNYANQIGYNDYGNKQSIRGYFREVSGNKLDYTNNVVGYYTAKNNKAYYTDPDTRQGIRAQELIKEALSWLNTQQNYDFSGLSTDGNGRVLGLNVFYTGEPDTGWAKGLWPHQGRMSQNWCADGVCMSAYQITNMSDALSIGTFIHESGHLIGNWPDLYDYDGSSDGSAGSHCVMGYGMFGDAKFKPVPPNGYFRSLAGWETVTELNPAVDANAPSGNLTHKANSNTVYSYTNPNNSDEAFYIETRTKTGQSEHMPDEGLVVWHIDGDGSNSKEWHPHVQMEHADGARDPENGENRGDDLDMYDASQQNSFGNVQPNALASKGTNSRWTNGSDSGLELTNISNVSSNMTFTVDDGGPVDPPGDVYTGNLSGKNDQDIHPDGTWFYHNSGGKIHGILAGPANADFDLKLQKWQANGWNEVSRSETSTSDESISYSAQTGYYRFVIYSYSGSGNYTFVIQK